MATPPESDPGEPVRLWFDELFSRGDLAVADEILADEINYEGPASLAPADVTGPEDVKEYVDQYRTAFPDLQYTVEEMALAGDEVRVRWSATGTHESDIFAVDPTGQVFTVDGINIFVVEEGTITEVYAQWDTLKLVQELGIVPPIGEAE